MGMGIVKASDNDGNNDGNNDVVIMMCIQFAYSL